MTNIHIALPSYKRAGLVKTQGIAPSASIYVPESQADEYRQHHENVVGIPDKLDGNIARKRNAILDLNKDSWVLMMDDDLGDVAYWEDGTRHIMTPGVFMDFVEKYFDLADQMGVKLWGINQKRDEMAYQCMRPFNLLSPILGPFSGHLGSNLRYDETCGAKEDYDYWLQHIQRHRKTLRINKYHYRHAHGTGQQGGLTAIRSMEYEQAAADRMIQKWGRDIIKVGGSGGGKGATGQNILNLKITVPIKGC